MKEFNRSFVRSSEFSSSNLIDSISLLTNPNHGQRTISPVMTNAAHIFELVMSMLGGDGLYILAVGVFADSRVFVV